MTGNKQKGLDYLREVSHSGSTSSNDAAMALSLFLRREQMYPEALTLVSGVSRQYPRNFLMAVEYAHLLNAAGHGREAIAQYRGVLEKGREGKFTFFHLETAAWGLGVSLRGQREFAQAAEAFDQVATVKGADPALVQRALVASGEMHDTLGNARRPSNAIERPSPSTARVTWPKRRGITCIGHGISPNSAAQCRLVDGVV